MFELSIASKYLTPRWRQLSVSIISLISVLVIALVVWLIVVFFSVTYGLEKSWIGKLIALTAPIRITPTEQYYNSYYFQADAISNNSGYNYKTIGEKLVSAHSDPYDPTIDEEPPEEWAKPLYNKDGTLKDLVKEAFKAVENLPLVTAKDYEVSVATLHLNLLRSHENGGKAVHQASFIGSYDPENKDLAKSLMTLSGTDTANLSIRDNTTEKVYLPRSYRDAGVLAGDAGYLSYTVPTASSMQEQRIPIHVAGFYDPGIIPMGGKLVLTSREITGALSAAQHQEQASFSNGINIRFDDWDRAESIKNSLETSFAEAGILPYWKIETFREYEYTRDVLQQLRSEKHLFSLLAAIIIIVACSNIISMLIILVNDKKVEIGILRSMGASSASIALIFGACGFLMGLAGSLVGTVAAIFTLRNLEPLISLLSRLQGHDMFNPIFYGEKLPTELSYETILFVIMATGAVSLIAGLVPAIKACLMRPAAILKAE